MDIDTTSIFYLFLTLGLVFLVLIIIGFIVHDGGIDENDI